MGAHRRHVHHRRTQARIRSVDTGAPISMPVGEGVMGRVFNVTGEAVDEQGPCEGR